MVRKRWALSQRDLAELLGFKGRVSISGLENCRTNPSAKTLLALDVIFGARMQALFPEFFDQIEDRIVGSLYRMQQRLEEEDRDSPQTRTKHQLLAEALSRAVLRTKHPMAHDL
jgi:transcriptional regulator with XRE-family HTH domain